VKKHIFEISIATYFFIALITFGYSYNAEYPTGKTQYEGDRVILATAQAVACGISWPAYLTVNFFKQYRPAIEK
jgi:hypothetical protein